MIATVRTKMIGAELMSKLGKLSLPGVDFAAAKAMATATTEAVRTGTLGYAILIGSVRSQLNAPFI